MPTLSHPWTVGDRAVKGFFARSYSLRRNISFRGRGCCWSETLTSESVALLTTTSQGKYTEAEPLYDRCQAIEEEILGPEHPSLATTLSNRAGLLTSLVRDIRMFYKYS